MQLIGPAIIAAFLFAIVDGFHDALGWDAVQAIFAMILMVPCAALIVDRLLYPSTRARFENSPSFGVKFLIFVTGFAFILYTGGVPEFERIEHGITRFAALWWIAFPYSCGMILIADRIFNAYKGRHQQIAPAPRSASKAASPPAVGEEDDNAFAFDPKRFKGKK